MKRSALTPLLTLLLAAALAAPSFAQAPAHPQPQSQPQPQSADLPRIAVYVVGGVSDNEKAAFGTRILASLINSGRYTGFDRSTTLLAELDKEQQKQPSVLIDDRQISAVGKRYGVSFICIGAITPVLGDYQVAARIVNVETAKMVFIGETYTHLRNVIDLARAADNVVKNMFSEQVAVLPEPRAAPVAEAAPQAQGQDGEAAQRKAQLERQIQQLENELAQREQAAAQQQGQAVSQQEGAGGSALQQYGQAALQQGAAALGQAALKQGGTMLQQQGLSALKQGGGALGQAALQQGGAMLQKQGLSALKQGGGALGQAALKQGADALGQAALQQGAAALQNQGQVGYQQEGAVPSQQGYDAYQRESQSASAQRETATYRKGEHMGRMIGPDYLPEPQTEYDRWLEKERHKNVIKAERKREISRRYGRSEEYLQQTQLKPRTYGTAINYCWMMDGHHGRYFEIGAASVLLINNHIQFAPRATYRYGSKSSNLSTSGVGVSSLFQFSTDYRRMGAFYGTAGLDFDMASTKYSGYNYNYGTYNPNPSGSSDFNTTFVLGLGVAINRCVHIDFVRFNLGSESSFTTGARLVF